MGDQQVHVDGDENCTGEVPLNIVDSSAGTGQIPELATALRDPSTPKEQGMKQWVEALMKPFLPYVKAIYPGGDKELEG